MFSVWSDYLSKEMEGMVIEKIDYLDEPDITSATTAEEILNLQQHVKTIHVSNSVREYIIDLVDQARHDADVMVGPSTRATIALYKGSRALAFLEGRDFTIPDDVKKLLPTVFGHRIRLKPEAEIEGITPRDIIERILDEVPVSKVE
jgi:MoxR-like ATPase